MKRKPKSKTSYWINTCCNKFWYS